MTKFSDTLLNGLLNDLRKEALKLDKVETVEKTLREMLQIVEARKTAYAKLSDVDKLTEMMLEFGIPHNARAIDLSGDPRPNFDEKAVTRKNTKIAAKKILEITDQDFEKAVTIVKTMR